MNLNSINSSLEKRKQVKMSGNIKYLKYNKLFLTKLTLWPDNQNGRCLNFIKSIIFFSSILPFLYGFWADTVFNITDPETDLHTLLASLQASCLATLVFFYILIFYIKRKQINDLIPGLQVLEQYYIPQDLAETVNKANFYVKWLQIYVLSNSTLIILLAYVFYYFCNLKEDNAHKNCVKSMLPFSFPFRFDQTPMFQIVTFCYFYYQFIYQTVGFGFIMLIISTIAFVLEHFRHLKYMIIEVFKGEDIDEKLRKWIEYHVAILTFCKKIDNTFNLFYMVYFYIASIGFGVMAYQIATLQSLYHAIPLTIQFLAFCFVAFIAANTSQSLREESMSVADTIYNMDWADLRLSTQKDILFIMKRSMMPASISNMVRPVGINSFTFIMRGSYSFIAIIANLK